MISFQLDVVVSDEGPLIAAKDRVDRLASVHAHAVQLSHPPDESLTPRWALLLPHAGLVDAYHLPDAADVDETRKLSHAILSALHPVLAQNFLLHFVIRTPSQDFLLLPLSPYTILEDLLEVSHVSLVLLSTLEFSQELPSHGQPQLPTCPACLHRIEPSRLGLTVPRRSPPSSSHCVTCSILDHHPSDLQCQECHLTDSVWICLVCGVLGCGRYANKHAAQHYTQSHHGYALALQQNRSIWSYVDGAFVHWVIEHAAHPKAKSLGHDYEALLQSALLEQAQHYEGQMSQMRVAGVGPTELTPTQVQQVEALRNEIGDLRQQIDKVGRSLLEAQANEAQQRAKSQSLLKEQQVTQELLKKIQSEIAEDRERGVQQMEELEQQLNDLMANQRMMQQFSRDEELSQAQIWGLGGDESNKKKGKKNRRSLGRKR